MVSRSLAPLLAGVVGAVLGALLVTTVGSEPGSAVRTDQALIERLDALEARVAELDRRTAAPALRGRGSEQDRVAPGLAALAERITAVENETSDLNQRGHAPNVGVSRPEDMSIDALVLRARQLERGKHGTGLAVPYWREVLERNGVADALRIETLNRLGWELRKLKQHDEEAEIFRRLADLAGPGTKEGARALYDLSWTRWYQKDVDGAFRTMSACARARGSEGQLQRPALYHAADWAWELGHRDEARELASDLARLCAGSKAGPDATFAERAKSLLERLDRR